MFRKFDLVHITAMIAEANNLPKEPWESGYIPQDVVVLVIDRASVEFDCEPTLLDYERVRIKENPYILAIAGVTQDGVIRNSHRALCRFPQRLQQKAMLAFKMLIGDFGVYAFKRIWALTVPESWRNEADVDPTPGKVRG